MTTTLTSRSKAIVAARIGGGTEPTAIAVVFATHTKGAWQISVDYAEEFPWAGDHKQLDLRMADIASQVKRTKALSWQDTVFVVDSTLEPSYALYTGAREMIHYRAKVVGNDKQPYRDDEGRQVFGRAWLLSNAKKYLHPDPQGLPSVTFRRFAYAPDVKRAFLEITSKPPSMHAESFSDTDAMRRENLALSVCLALGMLPTHAPVMMRKPKVLRSARTNR